MGTYLCKFILVSCDDGRTLFGGRCAGADGHAEPADDRGHAPVFDRYRGFVERVGAIEYQRDSAWAWT